MPRRILSPSLFLAGSALALAAWSLAWLLGGLAYRAWAFGPGLAVLLAALVAGAWALVEEPELEPGGGALLGRLLAGGALLGLGESLLYPDEAGKEAWAALGFAGLAGGAALLWPGGASRARRTALAAAAALAALGIWMAAWSTTQSWDLFAGPAQGQACCLVFWALLACVFFALAASAAGPGGSAAAQAAAAAARGGRPLGRAAEAGLLALCLALAAALRFNRAGLVPPGWWYDEINLARATQDLLTSPGPATSFLADHMYVGDQVENPGAYLWLGAALFRAFGVHVEVLRVAAGAFGLLALLPFWALARLWLGQRWALAASFVFGVMHWMLIPQRIAFMSGFALFWMLASFWALWAAQLRGGWRRWLLAGLLLGANLHTYTPARFVPLAVLAFLGLQAVLDPFWRRGRLEWGAFAAGFLLVAGPMLAYVATHWGAYLYRSEQVSIFTDASVNHKALLPELWGSFAKHALMFQFRGDFNARHNVHNLPHADFMLACALALAFPWTLGRAWRDARGRFLWIWLAIMLAAGVFTLPVEAPQGHRSILAAPALPLAAAWTLRDLLARFRAAFTGGWPVSALALGAALLAGLAFLNVWNVFAVWEGSEATFRSFSPRASAVARRILASPPGTAVYVSELPKEYQFNGYEWGAFASFFLRQGGRSWLQLRPSQPVAAYDGLAPAQRALLVWGESDTDITQAFAREFPGREPEKLPQPFPGPGEPTLLYLAAELPVDALPRPPFAGAPPLLYRTP